MKEIFQVPVELQGHHLDRIRRLSSLRRNWSPLKIAREDTERIARITPEYLLDNPQYKEQLELAVAAAIKAYRHGKIRSVPDGQADFICVNCHNAKCPQGIETGIKIARQLVIPPQEWEKYGIKPLNPKMRIIMSPQMGLIRAYELSRG